MTPNNQNYKNIFLVGFMGAGKSTVGMILAEKIGYKYCDADKFIEKQAGNTITKIFAEHGENYFRDLESESMESLSAQEKQVVATGGGVVQRDRNWDAMNSGGTTIYLKAPIEVIWERIKHSKDRPLLLVENPFETARELLNKRTPLYERADLIVDTSNLSLEEVAEEIIQAINI
ncbi:MAG: shikimate kinase [Thermodesulfobacteriota bacterium]|nr:shikimate kinase [Candidatus Dadabacteria bacterium]MCH8014329.1 shikimate kinase [Candidatus Dadabacteria bacterium]TDJ02419.1 MAG: shikimate kinase [Candidatus Dadabacteria bacterium]